MKSVTFLAVVLLIGSTACASDDPTARTTLKAAYAEHAVAWQNGKMRFVSKADHPGFQCIDVSGELEWSKEYAYFRGERIETRTSGDQVGVIKNTVQVLRSSGEVAALLHRCEVGKASFDIMYYFPDDGNRDDGGILNFIPDYQLFMFSLSPLKKRDFLLAVRPDDNADNEKVVRTIESDKSAITVFNQYNKTGTKYQLRFRLDAGALCDLMEVEQLQKGGIEFDQTTRKWTQTSVGSWFPEESEIFVRKGSKTAAPFFHYTLAIAECRPLDRPSISASPSVTVFGALPDGVLIGTRGTDGKLAYQDMSGARQPELEELLKAQAKKLRGAGFTEGPSK